MRMLSSVSPRLKKRTSLRCTQRNQAQKISQATSTTHFHWRSSKSSVRSMPSSFLRSSIFRALAVRPETASNGRPMSAHEYSSDFYDYIDSGSRASAREVAGLLLGEIKIGSLLDVGAG